MSPELEAVMHALYDNQVPGMWAARAYPSLKPLSSWVQDLQERCHFIADWAEHGTPTVFWIPGFFFPQVEEGWEGGHGTTRVFWIPEFLYLQWKRCICVQ
jgi:hypothetical protein